MNTQGTKTVGEVMKARQREGIKAIVIGVTVLFLVVGVVYTGIHNFNLFSRTLPADQRVFALIPVVLIEGGILLFMAGGFFWFSGGAQKTLASGFGWVLFAIVAGNTMVDSMTASSSTIPEWLNIYASYFVWITPVLVMAMIKLVLDLDPARKRIDREKALEHAREEAEHLAVQEAMMGEDVRVALQNYGRGVARHMGDQIRLATPEPSGVTPVLAMNASAPVDEVKIINKADPKG